jgi:hypothetical protein
MTGELTQGRLKELLDYDPETGLFQLKLTRGTSYRRKNTHPTHAAGYVKYGIDNKQYLAHRLAFLYMTGAFPAGRVDHINGNRADNRWCNLREVTNTQHLLNRFRSRQAKYPGVWVAKNKGRQTYYARVSFGGKSRHLGTFASQEEAFAAYLMEIAELYGEAEAQIIYNRAMMHNQH